MENYTDEQKIEFMDINGEYIDRIMNVLQSKKFYKYLLPGTLMLKWLAEWLEEMEIE